MLDILVINSPIANQKVSFEDSLPPYGLGYIVTKLMEEGINVKLLDCVFDNVSSNEVLDVIQILSPKFVGINIFTVNFSIVKEIIESCKQKVHFIVGGQVTKFLYGDIIRFISDNNVDVIIGEGEYIVSDIVKGIEKEKPIHELSNRRVFSIHKNSIYFPSNIDLVKLDRGLFKNDPLINHFGLLESSIITSRGCIYNCAFCGAAKSLNKDIPIRELSKKAVERELLYIKDCNPKVSCIRVLDDLFLKDINSVEQAADIFRRFNVYWRAMAHIKSFKNCGNYHFNNLFESGCLELFVGIESGSNKILRMINKSHDLEFLKETIIRLLSAGINIKGYFIYGFPNEGESEFKQTYTLAAFLKKESLKCKGNFRVSVFQFRPYHGTSLCSRILDKYGVIKEFKENVYITSEADRRQFNYYSENYSNCTDSVVNEYIIKTMNLNNIFFGS